MGCVGSTEEERNNWRKSQKNLKRKTKPVYYETTNMNPELQRRVEHVQREAMTGARLTPLQLEADQKRKEAKRELMQEASIEREDELPCGQPSTSSSPSVVNGSPVNGEHHHRVSSGSPDGRTTRLVTDHPSAQQLALPGTVDPEFGLCVEEHDDGVTSPREEVEAVPSMHLHLLPSTPMLTPHSSNLGASSVSSRSGAVHSTTSSRMLSRISGSCRMSSVRILDTEEESKGSDVVLDSHSDCIAWPKGVQRPKERMISFTKHISPTNSPQTSPGLSPQTSPRLSGMSSSSLS